jgi:hypothetical protein
MSGEDLELEKGRTRSSTFNRVDSPFMPTAIHAEHVRRKGQCSGEQFSSDDDAILPTDDFRMGKRVVVAMELESKT